MKNTSGFEDGTNESGFSALPGGYRGGSGPFGDISKGGHWWSFTEFDTGYAWNRSLYSSHGVLTSLDYNKTDGFSVRCLRD
jgi:uncharacterized protein (TIGR02145 family)